MSSYITICHGVLQGRVLSSSFFNVYMIMYDVCSFSVCVPLVMHIHEIIDNDYI